MFGLSIPWLKLLKYGAALATVGGVIWFIYDKGDDHGQAKINAEWSAERTANTKAIDELKLKIANQEKTHAIESGRISTQLETAKEDSARELLRLDAVYSVRLRQSEDRSAGYLRLAQSGPAQCLSVASHAAELDGSLEEGRRLVGELRQGIVEKDRQLNLLGSQILNDRTLLSGTNDRAAH